VTEFRSRFDSRQCTFPFLFTYSFFHFLLAPPTTSPRQPVVVFALPPHRHKQEISLGMYSFRLLPCVRRTSQARNTWKFHLVSAHVRVFVFVWVTYRLVTSSQLDRF
jgi:hypothetical protein